VNVIRSGNSGINRIGPDDRWEGEWFPPFPLLQDGLPVAGCGHSSVLLGVLEVRPSRDVDTVVLGRRECPPGGVASAVESATVGHAPTPKPTIPPTDARPGAPSAPSSAELGVVIIWLLVAVLGPLAVAGLHWRTRRRTRP
jgi:hypothetical protein